MANHIITKQILIDMLNNSSPERRAKLIGRALVVLFNRQTEAEKQHNATMVYNNIGFTGADGHSGVLSAKSFLKNKSLEDWQVKKWMKLNKKGEPRIAKYWAQLDQAAQAKAAAQKAA